MSSSRPKKISTLLRSKFPGLVARLEYKSKRKNWFYPWGGPMNGQTARLEICRQIICDLGVQAIVETGTYRGTTTEWFAQFKIPVTSIEINRHFAEFSRLRFSDLRNVSIVVDNSVNGLARLFADPKLVNLTILYYLDSHWEEYLPLADELKIISDHNAKAIILIDDFEVPHDAGYKYDDYGDGRVLNLQYLLAGGIKGFKFYFPAVAAFSETGSPRGYVVCTADSELATQLRRITLLQEYCPN